jgi:hypothetical protein
VHLIGNLNTFIEKKINYVRNRELEFSKKYSRQVPTPVGYYINVVRNSL